MVVVEDYAQCHVISDSTEPYDTLVCKVWSPNKAYFIFLLPSLQVYNKNALTISKTYIYLLNFVRKETKQTTFRNKNIMSYVIYTWFRYYCSL